MHIPPLNLSRVSPPQTDPYPNFIGLSVQSEPSDCFRIFNTEDSQYHLLQQFDAIFIKIKLQQYDAADRALLQAIGSHGIKAFLQRMEYAGAPESRTTFIKAYITYRGLFGITENWANAIKGFEAASQLGCPTATSMLYRLGQGARQSQFYELAFSCYESALLAGCIPAGHELMQILPYVIDIGTDYIFRTSSLINQFSEGSGHSTPRMTWSSHSRRNLHNLLQSRTCRGNV